MSENSNRLAVDAASGSTTAWLAAGIMATFVLGVIGGALAERSSTRGSA